jgi:hypothetical protein
MYLLLQFMLIRIRPLRSRMWKFTRRAYLEIQNKYVFYVILSAHLTLYKLETAQNIFNLHMHKILLLNFS